MSTIFRKEFRSYFTSPIGYVVLAVITGIAALGFVSANIYGGSIDLSSVFSIMLMFSLLSVSLLTMRIFSEEKKQKTDQILFTSPVSITGIVLGKFLAALVVFTLAISITLVFALIINIKVNPNWAQVIGNFLGLAMVGGVVIAVGTLISSVTENQMVSAFGTFGVTLLLLFMDGISDMLSGVSWLANAVSFLSIQTRYSDFTKGIIAYDNIIFFLSVQALVLFLTVRILDSKRWN